MAGLLSTDIMNDAALLLNDANRVTFSYAVQTPWLKRAINELSDELAVNNIPLLEKISSPIIPTIAGIVTTIAMPSDCLLPLKVEERALGSADRWTEVFEVTTLDPNLIAGNAFGYWSFEGSLLNSVPVLSVPNATSLREIRLTYQRFVNTVGVDLTTDFTTQLTFQCKRFVSAKIAELITRFVLQNNPRSLELGKECNQSIYRLIQIWTKKRQNRPIRKSGYNKFPINDSPLPSIGSGGSSGPAIPVTGLALYDYYVRDHGAKGDGVADDTAAIQATINLALATGGRVIFDPKVYLITSLDVTMTGGRPILLLGYGRTLNIQVAGTGGTTLKSIGFATPNLVSFIACNSCGMYGFNLEGGVVSRPNIGLYIDSCVGCTFDQISAFRINTFGIQLHAGAAGCYANYFSNISTDTTCGGGLLADGASALIDVGENTFVRLDLGYSGSLNAGLDLKSADNNSFLGLRIQATDNLCGPLMILRAAAGVNLGAAQNIFYNVDGNTAIGAARGIRADSLLVNLIYGLNFNNGLIIDVASAHPELLFIHDTVGSAQTNLLQFPSGKAFGGSTVPTQLYYDTTANLFRFQNRDPATARGWRFSNSIGAGAQNTEFDISPIGELTERGRAVPLGVFTNVAFNAGDFTASAGTWTVIVGNLLLYQWTIIGDMLTLTFDIQGTSISNAGALLRLKIPNGYTVFAGKEYYNPIRSTDNGGAAATGLAKATGGNNYVTLYATIAGAGWSISVTNANVQGQIVFRVANP